MITKKILTMAFLLTVALTAFGAAAQEDASDQQAGMEAWMAAATPGPFHEFLAQKEGSWNIAGKMWMAPDAPPMDSQSTGQAEMILGGRYLQETMEGENMGMPFEGMGVTGYDNSTGMVTSVWYDNMGTATTVLMGPYEEPGTPMELFGDMLDPVTGQQMTVRTLSTFISHDESLFEYFATPPGGDEVKVMELRYTRAP